MSGLLFHLRPFLRYALGTGKVLIDLARGAFLLQRVFGGGSRSDGLVVVGFGVVFRCMGFVV